MGRKATFVKSRFQEFRRKKEQRQERSDKIRQHRRGHDGNEQRLVQKVLSARALPSKDQQELLFSQFLTACRLPGAPSEDLCRLIRSYDNSQDQLATAAVAGEKKAPTKRPRSADNDEGKNGSDHDALAEIAALAQKLVALPLGVTGAEGSSVAEETASSLLTFDEIVRSESGSRVVGTLLAVLKPAPAKTISSSSNSSVTGSAAAALQEHVLKFFEHDVRRLEHFVASKLIYVLCEHGGDSTRTRIAQLLQQHVTKADDRLAAFKTLMTERHTSSILVRLLGCEDISASVRQWLQAELQLTAPASSSTTSLKKNARRGEEAAAAAASVVPMTVTERADLIRFFIADPNAAAVMTAFVSDETRAQLFQIISFATLLTSKRGNRMLGVLMTPTSSSDRSGSNQWADEMLDTILMRESREEASVSLCDMSYDSTGNFVVQSIAKLLPFVSTAENCATYGRRVLDLMLPTLAEMSRHPIAVHVVLVLIDAFAKAAELYTTKVQPLFHQLVKQILGPDTVLDLVRDRFGSLVTRKLIDVFAAGGSKLRAESKLLLEVLEQHMSALMYDATGNLVAQQLINAEGISGAGSFYQKFVKREDVLAMAQHPSAAHVLCALLDKGDVQTSMDLCASLKPHVMTIAKHLNGRFVCERMLAVNRDIRDNVTRAFHHLALQKGTQHLLLKLVETMEPHKRTAFFQNVILPQFVSLSTNATASIVIQKMLQQVSNREFLVAAKEFMKKQPATVLRDMQQNFHGAFVARILMSSE